MLLTISKHLFCFSVKISVNDLVIKAAATALQYVPEVNINALGDDDFQVCTYLTLMVIRHLHYKCDVR